LAGGELQGDQVVAGLDEAWGEERHEEPLQGALGGVSEVGERGGQVVEGNGGGAEGLRYVAEPVDGREGGIE
jgi:hypothetical protein